MSKTVQHPAGFYVKQCEDTDKVPLDCPVCDLSLRDQSDVLSYTTYMCCSECKVTWAEPNRTRWKEGWRPSKEKISKYRENLLSRPSYLVI